MITYKVTEDKAVEIFVPSQAEAALRVYSYPNGDSFDSIEEATEWAILYAAAMNDKDAPFAPAGKGLAGRPKPAPEEELPPTE